MLNRLLNDCEGRIGRRNLDQHDLPLGREDAPEGQSSRPNEGHRDDDAAADSLPLGQTIANLMHIFPHGFDVLSRFLEERHHCLMLGLKSCDALNIFHAGFLAGKC